MIIFRFILKEKEKCDRGAGGSWTTLVWDANITELCASSNDSHHYKQLAMVKYIFLGLCYFALNGKHLSFGSNCKKTEGQGIL